MCVERPRFAAGAAVLTLQVGTPRVEGTSRIPIPDVLRSAVNDSLLRQVSDLRGSAEIPAAVPSPVQTQRVRLRVPARMTQPGGVGALTLHG
jgi:hypothetical protein